MEDSFYLPSLEVVLGMAFYSSCVDDERVVHVNEEGLPCPLRQLRQVKRLKPLDQFLVRLKLNGVLQTLVVHKLNEGSKGR